MNASILQTTEEIKVTVTTDDYSFTGVLVGIAITRSGKIRYVVEDDEGRLFIHTAEHLGVGEGWMPM